MVVFSGLVELGVLVPVLEALLLDNEGARPKDKTGDESKDLF